MAALVLWQQFKLIALQLYVLGIVRTQNAQINLVINFHNNLFVTHCKILWVVPGKIRNARLSLNVQIMKQMMDLHVLEKVLVKQYLRKTPLECIHVPIKLIYQCIV